MEISCSGCGKLYRIDRSKLPPSGRAVMKCPGCGFKIAINIEPEDAVTPSSADRTDGYFSEHSEKSDTAADSSSYGFNGEADDDAGFEIFEPGTRTALVFCPDYDAMTQLEKGLKQKGYEIRSCSSAREVQARFRYHIYDLLILYQAGPEPENRLSDILKWVNNTSMDIRRRVLVLHISMNGNLHDTMQAFSLGVDAMLSPLDLANLPALLDKIEKQRESRYRVFDECLARVKEEVF